MAHPGTVQRRLYWRAITSLAEAEAVARLRVAGQSDPTDQPPASEAEEPAWYERWAQRAREVLADAGRKVRDGNRGAVEAAREMAAKVRKGADALLEAAKQSTPWHAGVRAVKKVRDTASNLERHAIATGLGVLGGAAGFAVLLVVGYLILKSRS